MTGISGVIYWGKYRAFYGDVNVLRNLANVGKIDGTHCDGEVFDSDGDLLGTYGDGEIYSPNGDLAGVYGNGKILSSKGDLVATYDGQDEGAAACALIYEMFDICENCGAAYPDRCHYFSSCNRCLNCNSRSGDICYDCWVTYAS